VILPISAIKVGDRVRKDMGDLSGLAASMKTHGLLHPVVVKADHTLVAGHRRIEAARLLGCKAIAVTVVEVDDLLSAERDENRERKDFTPTEAVAIGKLIEEQERPRAVEAKRVGALRTSAKTSRADHGETPSSVARGPVRERAAAAVGMSAQKYTQAKAVVAAAEAEPEKYGDLPSRMDETDNVYGAHREMERRKDSTTGRHPVHYKKRYQKTNDIVRRAMDSLEGICATLADVRAEEADASEAPAWAKALEGSASAIRQFAKRLKNVKK